MLSTNEKVQAVAAPQLGRYQIDTLSSGFSQPGRQLIVVTQVQSLGYNGEPYAVVAIAHQGDELIFEQPVWEALNPVRYDG